MQKRLGIAFIVLGFVAAVGGGLWLAGQVSQGKWAWRDLTSSAVMLIVPITLLVGMGLFMIVRGGREPEVASAVELQRDMMDMLTSRGQITINTMAAELGVTPQTVVAMLEQLQQLDIFDGVIDWERGVLYSRQHRR